MCSKVKGSESKSNIACAAVNNLGLLNVQNVWSQHSPILWLLVPNDVSEKFKPRFSSLAAFPGTTPTFCKIYVRLNYAEFNAESIGTNLKSQKLKTKKLVLPFLLTVFHFEINLTIGFTYFQPIFDSWEFLSKSVGSRKISRFRQKKIFDLFQKENFLERKQKKTLFHCVFNIDRFY